MDISYYKKYEPVFGVWTIKEKIGEGSYGTVFELEREDFGRVYKAALKAITIPKSDSEIIGARAEGMDEESLRAHFQSIAKDMVDEFAILNLLKGNSNVVSYENHQVIRHEDGIGWDILIQMELLTPLNTYAVDNTITRRDVIRLGIDLCKALELCQKYGVMHRDVKPENIFVSANGDFKLGDFGIARKMEKHAGSVYSRKGTNAYMAPEVFKEEPYDSTVDIYSLGIVMYRLLNGKRTPFLPHAPANITAKDRENALMMRMSGKPLPKPIHAEGRLAEIVLKACAYNPRDRYSSPGEMRRELEAIQYSNAERPFIYPTGDDLPQDSYPSTGKKKDDTPQTGDEKVDVPNEKPEDAPVIPEAVPEDEPEQEGTHSGYDDEPAWENAVEPEDRTHSGYDDEPAWEPVSEDSGDKAPDALDHVPAWEDVKDDTKHAESADVMPWDEVSTDGQDTPESKPADDVPAAHTPKSPLLTGDLRSGFIRMALPLMLAMMASALPGFLEAAMTASWGSLAAFEAVAPYQTMIWALSVSVALGVLKLLPGKLEEGDEAGAHAVIRCAIGLDLILGVAFALISFLMRGAVGQYIWNMYGNSSFYHAFDYWFFICLFALPALLELLFVSLLILSDKPMLAALPLLAEAVLGCGGLILDWFGSQYGGLRIGQVGDILGLSRGIAQTAAALLGLFLNLRYNKGVPIRRRGAERQPGAMAALVRACALPLLATISLCLFASVVRCLFGNDDRAYLAAGSYSFLQRFMIYPAAALGMVGVCFMACLTAANRSEGRITVISQIRNLGLASIGLGAVLIFFMAGATIRTLPEEDVAFFIVPLLCMTVTMLCALCLDAVGRARVAAVLAAAQLIIAAPGILGISVGYIAGFSIEFAMLVVPSVVSMALLYHTSKKLTDMTK